MDGGLGEGEFLFDGAGGDEDGFLGVEAFGDDATLGFVFSFSLMPLRSMALSLSPPQMEARTSRLVSSCMSRTQACHGLPRLPRGVGVVLINVLHKVDEGVFEAIKEGGVCCGRFLPLHTLFLPFFFLFYILFVDVFFLIFF